MPSSLNAEARAVFNLAELEARQMNHGYVGTEHVLLALVGTDFGAPSQTLHIVGLDAESIRRETEKLVQRGSEPIAPGALPLTPRVEMAIQSAIKEARFVGETHPGPEHLLLGLMGDLEGVAGMVLRNLGLDASQLREEVLRPRLLQMKIVERAIRPLRASTASKRKMREELLAHLSAIYQQERTRADNALAAVDAAQKRFGEPAELAGELSGSLPRSERRAYFFERLFGWRAPETATRYLLRLCAVMYALLAVSCAAVAAVVVPLVGFRSELLIGARPALAMLLLLPAIQFLLGWLYFKFRDAMYGPPWARKSVRLAVLYDVLIGVVAFLAAIGFLAVSTWDWSQAWNSWGIAAAVAVAAAAGYFALAQHRGLIEISDTLWACLELDPPSSNLAKS